MTVLRLARVQRTAHQDTSPAPLYKIGTCACMDLTKGKKRRRKLRGSSKAYLRWLDDNTPALAQRISNFFDDALKVVAKSLASDLKLEKAKGSKAAADAAFDKINWDALYGVFNDALVDAHRQSSRSGLAAIGIRDDEAMVDQLDELALEYAEVHSADLVGRRRTREGRMVPNPNPDYSITETTREGLRDLTASAVEEGWSTGQLMEELLQAHEFSRARAETIARTELAFAHTHGNYAGWVLSEQVELKQSILGSEHDQDDDCNGNADEGPIPLDQEFSSGHLLPPYHPNCVCDVIPILKEEAQQTAEEDGDG